MIGIKARNRGDAKIWRWRRLSKTADEDERLLRESGIPEDMIKLAHSNIPENSDLNNLKNRSIEEKIIHFVDLITIGSEFVNFAERLQISEQKRQNIEFSESFRKKYNGKSLYEVQRGRKNGAGRV